MKLSIASKTVLSSFFLLVALAIVSFACSTSKKAEVPKADAGKGKNLVVNYLLKAGKRGETDQQVRVVSKALNDMLSVTPDELKKRKYDNYTGEPVSWTVIEVLEHYFLSDLPIPLRDQQEQFYRDLEEPEARKVIRQHLETLKASKQGATKF